MPMGMVDPRRSAVDCPYCGKKSYYTRKAARRAGRSLYPDDHLNAYRCLDAPDYVDTTQLWHIGHAPDVFHHPTNNLRNVGHPADLPGMAPLRPFPIALVPERFRKKLTTEEEQL